MENKPRRKSVSLEAKIQIFLGLTLVFLMGLSYAWIAKRADDLRENLLREKAKSTFAYVKAALKLLTGAEDLQEAPPDKIRESLDELSSKGLFDARMIAGSEKITPRFNMTREQNSYVFTYSAPLFEDEEQSNMGLLIAIPADNIQGRLKSFKVVLLLVIISSVIVALGIMYYIIRSAVIEPINHLKHIAERISAGDYTARSHITTGDELEEFSTSFNKMIRYLEDLNNSLDAKLTDLGQANLQLYEMNRQQREFIAVMSHELRTPLNSIIGFSEILREQFEGKIDEKQDKFLRNIHTSGTHLLRLINDILDSSRLETGRLEPHYEKVSIPKVIENALSMIDSARKEKVPVEIKLEKGLPRVISDGARLVQITFNILSNAFKVSPEGMPITIRAAKKGDLVRIEIVDRGPGISKEQIPFIFQKFRQVDGSRTRTFNGTGLGLSIVRELTSLLGGKVQVESEVGKGSNFIVDIPLSPEKRTNR